MGVKLVSSSGGSVELVAPTTASNFTHTVPAQTGTVLLKESTSGMSVPAFSAYQSTAQTIANNTVTKIQFQTKEFDTASCFDSTTNYRFTPNVAGYYSFYSCCFFNTGVTSTVPIIMYIFKNGSAAKQKYTTVGNANGYLGPDVMANPIYMNGTTDYVEIYIQQITGSSQSLAASSVMTWFSGVLVRAA